MEISALQKVRYKYVPKLPANISGDINTIAVEFGKPTESAADQKALKDLFKNTYGKPLAVFTKGSGNNTAKLKVGVILSGGQAPGGHNVIAGLYDGLKKGNSDSQLYGFLGGPSGLVENKTLLFTDEIISAYRNTGGFDIIG